MTDNSNAAAAADHEHEEHHTNYVKVWAILVGLLVVSILGPMIGIKVITLITAFGIAIVKAYLVAAKFMHLDIERRYVIYLLVTCVAFILLFFTFVAPDVMRHDGDQWTNDAAKAEVERALEQQKAAH